MSLRQSVQPLDVSGLNKAQTLKILLKIEKLRKVQNICDEFYVQDRLKFAPNVTSLYLVRY